MTDKEAPIFRTLSLADIMNMETEMTQNSLVETCDLGITLRWCNNSIYHIAWRRIDTKEKLLGWLRHLTEKSWDDMTTERLSYFIDKVYEKFCWSHERL